VHGSKDRAKDASPRTCNDLSCRCWLHALDACLERRMLTTFPSSASFGHSLSSARLRVSGGYRYLQPDRPRPSFRQHPAKGTAFQKIGMSFTVTTREGIDLPRRDCSLRPSRRLSRSRRPHFAPKLGTVLLIGHCECHGTVTRCP